MLRVALRPRFLGMLALMVAATVVCALLASWQWDRAHRALTSDDGDETQAAQPITEMLPVDDPVTNDMVGDPVAAAGTFEPEEQVAVPGRNIDGVEAVIVVTALHVPQDDGTTARLPVARGWIPAADVTTEDGAVDHELLPPAPEGEVQVGGRLEASEPATTGVEDGIAAEIAAPMLINAWGAPMYTAYLAQTTEAEGLGAMPPAQSAFARGMDWQNLGYAAQWVLFGAFFLYLWWRTVRTAYLDEQADRRDRLEASLAPERAAAPHPAHGSHGSRSPADQAPRSHPDQKDVTGVDSDSATAR